MQIQAQTLKVDDAALAWRATRHRGIAWLPLHPRADASGGDDRAGGDATVLIRMDPGCGYPRHRHLGVEEVLVLRGGYRDEWGDHVAGTYLSYAPGSEHAPVALGDPARPAGRENPACVLFAVARGGVHNLE